MNEIRSNIFFSFIEKNTAFVVAFISTIILSRILTPAETGLYSIAAASVNMAQSLREFGVYAYIMQERDLTEEKVGTSAGVALTVSGFLIALFFVASRPLAVFYGNPALGPMVSLLSLNFLIVSYSAIGQALLLRQMAFRANMIVALAAACSGAAVSVVLAERGFGATCLVWGSLSSASASLLGYFMVLGRSLLIRPNFSHWRQLAHFGVFSTGTGLLGTLGHYAPDLVIGRILGLASAGLFSRGNGLVTPLTTFITGAAGPVISSQFSRDHREGRDVQATYLTALNYSCMLVWPALAVVAVSASPIIALLFGPQWRLSVPVAQVLCAANLVGYVGVLSQTLMKAIGEVRQNFIIQCISIPFYILTVALGARVSLPAAALGALATSTLVSVVSVMALRRRIGLGFGRVLSALVAPLVSTIVTAVVALSVAVHFGFSVRALPLTGLATVAAWVITLYVLRHPLSREINLFRAYVAAQTARLSRPKLVSQRFVCLNNDGYDGLRRPRHIIMERLAAKGYRILFVSSAVSHFKQRVAHQLLKYGGLAKVSENFVWYQPPAFLPVSHRGRFTRIFATARSGILHLVIWLFSRGSGYFFVSVPDQDYLRYLRKKRDNIVIYNVHDRFLDQNDNWIPEHFEMLDRADVILCTSEFLLAEVRETTKKPSYLFPPGVDFDIFPRELSYRNKDRPQEGQPIRVGCIGSLGDQIDWGLMEALALTLTDYEFRFVGVVRRRVTDNPALLRLKSLPNVRFSAPVSHAEVRNVIAEFDICVLPYASTAFVKGINPLKLYEYFALGKPVVCSPIPSVQKFDALIYTATDLPGWETALRAAAAEDDEGKFTARCRVALDQNYDLRIDFLLSVLGLQPEAARREAAEPPQAQEGLRWHA